MTTILIILVCLLAALAVFFAVSAKVLSDELDRHISDAKALGLLLGEIEAGKALTDRRCYHLGSVYHAVVCWGLRKKNDKQFRD